MKVADDPLALVRVTARKSCYVLEVRASGPGYDLSYQFVYDDLAHIRRVLDQLLLAPERANPTLVLHELSARLYRVQPGRADVEVDVRHYLTARRGERAQPFLEAGSLLRELVDENSDERAIDELRIELDEPALRAAIGPLSGDRLGPGEHMIEGGAILSYGAWDTVTEAPPANFEDPNPASTAATRPSLAEQHRLVFWARLEDGDLNGARRSLEAGERTEKRLCHHRRAELLAREGRAEEAFAHAILERAADPNADGDRLARLRPASAPSGGQSKSHSRALVLALEDGLLEEEPSVRERMLPSLTGMLGDLVGSAGGARFALLAALGQSDAAERIERSLRSAPANDPDLASAHTVAGMLALEHANAELAISCFARAAELRPCAAAWLRLAEPIAARNRAEAFPLAERALSSWDALAPDEVVSRYAELYGISDEVPSSALAASRDVLADDGNVDGAMAINQRLVERRESDAPIERARLLLLLGKVRESLKALDTVLDARIDRSASERARAFYYRACAKAVQGDGAASLLDLERACELDGGIRERARHARELGSLADHYDFRVLVGLEIRLQEGLRVTHRKFGPGTVRAVVGKGEEAKLTIDFDGGGTRTLIARFIEPA